MLAYRRSESRSRYTVRAFELRVNANSQSAQPALGADGVGYGRNSAPGFSTLGFAFEADQILEAVCHQSSGCVGKIALGHGVTGCDRSSAASITIARGNRSGSRRTPRRS